MVAGVGPADTGTGCCEPSAGPAHPGGWRADRARDRPGAARGTVAEIIERAAGTPLLVEELARLASRPGQVLLVPDIVRAIVRERTERLSPQARELLQVAAVAGLEVDAALLTAIYPEGDPGDLVSAGLLNREEEGFRFRHPLLQEAAYEEVPAERRRTLHELIAAAMANSDCHSAERVAAHLERAGRPQAALAVLETAAQKADQAGVAGRKATLMLGAFQLAERHRSLAGRRPGLERAAITELFGAGRWSELDPLMRDAWPARHGLLPAERARLAAVFCAHVFWTGSVTQSPQHRPGRAGKPGGRRRLGQRRSAAHPSRADRVVLRRRFGRPHVRGPGSEGRLAAR